jgi:hypothetical protein
MSPYWETVLQSQSTENHILTSVPLKVPDFCKLCPVSQTLHAITVLDAFA